MVSVVCGGKWDAGSVVCGGNGMGYSGSVVYLRSAVY